MDIGTTRIDPRVLLTAVRHELDSIPPIESSAVGLSTPVHVVIEIWIQAGANEDDVRGVVERRLGLPFWIDLGMADATYTITAIHRNT